MALFFNRFNKSSDIFRALAVPLFGARSVSRSLTKKGMRSVLRYNYKEKESFPFLVPSSREKERFFLFHSSTKKAKFFNKEVKYLQTLN